MRQRLTVFVTVLAVVLGSALCGAAAIAQDQEDLSSATAILSEQNPSADEPLRDTDFGVATERFGLERRVEMYQWSAGERGFRRVWNAALIESSRFPADRQNPPSLPLESRRWWARVSVGGKPVAEDALKALGRWRDFRPGFSRLPANLAATFQPDGDGLSSSENPLEPQIGDLRVHWRELTLPSLAGRLELRSGTWQLSPEAARSEVVTSPAPVLVEVDEGAGDPESRWPWILLGLGLLSALAWWLSRRRPGHTDES